MAVTAPQTDARTSELRLRPPRARNSSYAAIGREVDDTELVERMLSGDRWAKEAFYRKHVERAYRVARRLVRNESDAEDVVQEAFAQAFVDLEKLREPSALRAWFMRIVVNRAHRKFRRRSVLQFFGWTPTPDTGAAMVCEEAPPEVKVELSLVARTLEEVSVPLKTAWVLRRVEGLSLVEVAEACAVSLATVKRRVAQVDAKVSSFIDPTHGKERGDKEHPA